jgi:hypothetical protein
VNQQAARQTNFKLDLVSLGRDREIEEMDRDTEIQRDRADNKIPRKLPGRSTST